MNLKKFDLLVGSHDWFYAYSDDSRVWHKGEAESRAINEVIKTSPQCKGLHDLYCRYIFAENSFVKNPLTQEEFLRLRQEYLEQHQ